MRRKCTEDDVVEDEKAFVEDRKKMKSFTAMDGCDVLPTGRPLRLELEFTNER
jgi:hypothetical protein